MPEPVSCRLELQEIETYVPGPDNPYPDYAWAGSRWERYPYTGKPDISADKQLLRHRVVVLENRYVRVRVLPDIGGRILSFYDKTAGQEIFMTPPSLRYQHIAQRGAWLAGGVEFNFGYHHHSVITVSPVNWTTGSDADGSACVWVGSTILPVESRWAVRIVLRPDRAALDLEIHAHGPEVLPGLMYYWTNVAVETGMQSRFYYFGKRAIWHSWPIVDGLDFSWYRNRLTGSDMFLLDCQRDYLGFYDFDRHHGLANTADRFEAPGQKYFTWGTHQLGRYWDEMFSDTGQTYCEIQRGRHPSQAAHESLCPMTQNHWRETWMPLAGTEGFSATENDLVLSVNNETAKAVIRLAALRPMAKLSVEAFSQDRPLGRWPADGLAPGEMFTQSVDLPAGCKCDRIRVCDSAGKTLLEWEEFVYVNEDRRIDTGVPLAPAAATSETAESIFAQAQWQRFWNWPRPNEQVLAQFQRVLTLDPGHRGTLLALAEIDFHAGQYARAAERCRKALERFPADGQLRLLLGWCLMRQGSPADAAEQFANAARAETTRRRGLLGVAQAHLKLQAPAKAAAAIERLLGENPQDLWGGWMQVLLLRRGGQVDRARELLAELLRRDPLWTRLHAEALLLDFKHELSGGSRRLGDDSVSAAMPYIEMGLWQDAGAILQVDESNEPFSPALRLSHLAYVQHKQGVSPAATLAQMAKSPAENANPWHTLSLDVLAELAAACPKEPMLPFMRGNILASRNRVDEAASAWQKARELGLAGPVLLRNLAIFAQHKGQKAQALELYRQAWRQGRPDDLALFCELDRFLARQGLQQERLEAYDRLPPEASSRSMVATRRVAQLLDLGQWDAALEEMSKREIYRGELEFSNRFNYIEALLGKGMALLAAGKLQAARETFALGLEYPRNLNIGRHGLFPNEAMVHYFLGLTAELAGQADQAREHFLNAVMEQHWEGTLPEAYEMLAHLALGRRERAMAVAEKLEKLTRRQEHWAGMSNLQMISGLVMLARGYIDQPRRIWQESLKEHPNGRFLRLHLEIPQNILDRMRRQPAQTV